MININVTKYKISCHTIFTEVGTADLEIPYKYDYLV